MSILNDSRFAGVPCTSFIDKNRVRRLFLQIRKHIQLADIGTDFTVHVWGEGEMLDAIAAMEWGYGFEKYWWVIADVNDIEFPLNVEVGRELIIPGRTFVESL